MSKRKSPSETSSDPVQIVGSIPSLSVEGWRSTETHDLKLDQELRVPIELLPSQFTRDSPEPWALLSGSVGGNVNQIDPSTTNAVRSILQSSDFKTQVQSTMNTPHFIDQLLKSSSVQSLITADPTFGSTLQPLIRSPEFQQHLHSNIDHLAKAVLSGYACTNTVTGDPVFQQHLASIIGSETFKRFTAQKVLNPQFFDSISSDYRFKQQILDLMILSQQFKDLAGSIAQDPFLKRTVETSDFIDKILQSSDFKSKILDTMVQSPSFKTRIESIIANLPLKTVIWNFISRDEKLAKQIQQSVQQSLTQAGPLSLVADPRIDTLETQLQQAIEQIGQLRSEIRDLQAQSDRSNPTSVAPILGGYGFSSHSVSDSENRHNLYHDFIRKPHRELKYGEWISITGDTPNDIKVYPSYQSAAIENQHLADWVCEEYRGPDPEPYIISAIATGGFGVNKKHPTWAYVKATIYKPNEEKGREVQMMIDPGAEITYGITEDVGAMKLESAGFQGQISGINGVGTPINVKHMKAEIEVGEMVKTPIRITCPVIKGGSWILGQNFLQLCKHTWTNGTDVIIELLQRQPT